MKAVLVGTVNGEKKLYYVIDADTAGKDGVLTDGENPKLVDFWKTAVKINGLTPIKSSSFHKFLWDGDNPDGEDEDRWNRVFVSKSQKIPEYMLSGVQIVSDVLKSSMKSKSINSRVSEFKTLMKTQNISIIRTKVGKTISDSDWWKQ